MRNVEIKNNSDWTPLKVEHEHDPMIRFKRKEITPTDSIKFISSEAQQTSVDCTFDQHSSYILTDRKKIDKIIASNDFVFRPEKTGKYKLVFFQIPPFSWEIPIETAGPQFLFSRAYVSPVYTIR